MTKTSELLSSSAQKGGIAFDPDLPDLKVEDCDLKNLCTIG
jgi:hypothetical protein